MAYSPNKKTAAALYALYEQERSTFLREARDSSKLTLPNLIPENARGTRSKTKTPFQAVGARGVNSLAAKLLLALLPPSTPFFKLTIDSLALMQEGASEQKSEMDKALRVIENALMSEIEVSNDRVGMFEALKHLIVGGNVLLYLTDKGLQVYPLEKYVIRRDPNGNTLEIIIKEYSPDEMEDELDIYTHVKRVNDSFMWHQECKNEKIPSTDGMSKVDVTPFIPLRFIRQSGESYGRGYVEEYRGDLISLEAMMKAIIEAAAASARTLFLVNPNGVTRASTLSKAPNGAIREGLASDVSVLQVNKGADLQVSFTAIQRIEDRLEYAFLMAKAVQRDAERVTSTELKILTNELENSLGGIYSILTEEFQLRYLKRRMHLLVKSGKAPKLPDNIVKLHIITGLQGLGRGHDRDKLIEFITTVSQALGGDIMRQFVNLDEAVKMLATSIGIDSTNLIKSPQQIAEEQQQLQQQELVRSLGSAALSSPLLDPQNNAKAQQLQEQTNANQEIPIQE